MYRLFIVEDDPGIANAVAAQAQAWNLQTHIVRDFSNVMHEFAEFSPHIVLLDIMLPFFDGYHWCSGDSPRLEGADNLRLLGVG